MSPGTLAAGLKTMTMNGSMMTTENNRANEDSISQIIASVLCDAQLQEKAIVGRLGLFIKKAMLIDSGEDLNKKAH